MQDGNQTRGIVSRQTQQPATPGGIVTTTRRAADLAVAAISDKLNQPPMTAREVVANARVLLKALFFDPRLSEDEMTVFEGHYVKAMSNVPLWAAREAFSNLVADGSRRSLPRPGEVKDEANRIMAPLRAEVKSVALAALPAPEPEPEKSPEERAASRERMADVIGMLRAAAGHSKI
jgi:hypothetical protein